MKRSLSWFLGDGPTCGHAIVMHEKINKIAFTGSVEVRLLLREQVITKTSCILF